MKGMRVAPAFVMAGLAACGGPPPQSLATGEAARQQVESTERAFARTMADRNLQAFGEVLESGTLALSTGPVRDAQGKLIGRFASIWRQEQPGQWQIVFDRGEAAPAD